MARVCMLLNNPFVQDPRVEREARALARAGHDVTVIATWEPGATPRNEVRDGIRIRRVSRRPSGVDLVTRTFEAVLGPDAWTTSAGATPPRDAVTAPAVLRVPIYALRRRLAALPNQRAATALRMTVAVWRARPDVVHAHDLTTLEAGARAARRARAKLIYDSHEIAAGLASVRDPARVMRLERSLIRRADAVIHATPMGAQWTARTYGIPVPTVVRNVPEGGRSVTPIELAAVAGFPHGTKVILHQGYMSPDRGLEALVASMGSLDGYGLLLLGRGRLRPDLEKIAAELGLADRVRFHDPVPHDELLAWTAGAWCGASLLVDTCLNHRFALPNKLFENLAVGVPLIASDNPQVAEVISEHGCGELCDPTDPGSIVAAVRRLDARYESVAAAARAAGETYRWETEEAVLLQLYERLTVSSSDGAARAGS